MGGAESIFTALNNLDRFAWVGSFSGAFVMWPNPAAPGAGPTPAPAAVPVAAPVAPAAVAGGAPAPGAAAPGAGRGRGGGAAITPAALDRLFPTASARLNSQLKLLWISCGTADGLLGVNRTFKEWLRSKDVRFYEEEAEGVGHVWPLWRQDFANFAQRVFK
jgi:enterochelin esterase-like enzyme